MVVRHVMSRFPTIISPQIPCSEALQVSRSSGAHFLLVVDGDRLVGVARACDLLKARADRLVARSMQLPVVTIGEHEPMALARRMLVRAGGGCLVVTDRGGALKGILTCEDLRRSKISLSAGCGQACAACGATHHLLFGQPDEPVFCCACVDQARAHAQITLTLEPVTRS